MASKLLLGMLTLCACVLAWRAGSPQPAIAAEPQSQPAAALGTAPDTTAPFAGPRAKPGDRPRLRAGRFGRGPGVESPQAGDDRDDSVDAFLTSEQVDRLMKFLDRNFPVIHDRLERARERDPATFQRMLRRTSRIMLPMVRAELENPELGRRLISEHKAQVRIEDLKDKYRRTTDKEQKARVRQEIRKEMETAFESRMDRLRIQVKQLQDRLDEARDALSTQEKQKDKLIDERLSDVLADRRSAFPK